MATKTVSIAPKNYTPFNNALQSKINPQPLQPIKSDPFASLLSGNSKSANTSVQTSTPTTSSGFLGVGAKSPTQNLITNSLAGQMYKGTSTPGSAGGASGSWPNQSGVKTDNTTIPTYGQTTSDPVQMQANKDALARNVSTLQNQTSGTSAQTQGQGNFTGGTTAPPPPTTPPPPVSNEPDYKNMYQEMVSKLGNQQNSPYNQQTGTAIDSLQGQASGTNPAQTSITGLQNIAQNQTPEVIKQQKNYNDFAQSSPYMLAAQYNPNVAADIASGRSSLLGQTFGQILGAKSQAVSNALSSQGQQISAGGTAGQLGLTGQGQQITAAGNAGNLAQTGQGQVQSALGTAAGYAAPQSYDPVNSPYSPYEGTFQDGGGDRAFSGGERIANKDKGIKYSYNDSTIKTLGGQDGNSGMVGDFNSALSQAGTNSGTTNLGNALKQGLSVNTSGPYAGLQTSFANILQQYAKILGPQAVNDLMTSSNNQTIAQFFQSLSRQAQRVQSGLSGKDSTTSNTSNNSNSGSGGQFDW